MPTKTKTLPFRDYLRGLMSQRGYATPADLARASGMDASNLSRWFSGETGPSISVLQRIAGPLGVRLGDLMVAAGVATAEELGMVGAAPPPGPPLPAVLRRIVSRLIDPRIHDDHKHQLMATIDQLVGMWDKMRETPIYREPQMRRKG